MPVRFVLDEDITESDAECITIPVNTKGVMGKGLALRAKHSFPGLYESYVELCKDDYKPGNVALWVDDYNPGGYVALFATKDHWRNPSRISWIAAGLSQLMDLAEEYDVKSIAIPKLGCGLGGLAWPQVRRLVIQQFELSWVEVDIYESSTDFKQLNSKPERPVSGNLRQGRGVTRKSSSRGY